MKKIVITGPESTGKSTLCKHLSESIFIPHVREYAREYINVLGRPYEKHDLISIAKGQIELEEDILSHTPSMLLCDTDLLTIKIWSEFKYGGCDDFIVTKLKKNLPDLYILTYPDFPWVEDSQRENEIDREQLFDIYESEIKNLGVSYVVLKGDENERLQIVMELLSNYIS